MREQGIEQKSDQKGVFEIAKGDEFTVFALVIKEKLMICYLLEDQIIVDHFCF